MTSRCNRAKTAQLYLLEVKQASQLPHLGWNSARSAYAGSGISGEPPRDPNQLSASTVIDYKWLRLAWVPVWSFFLLFYFSVPWSKILIEINNGQPIPLMWYFFILLFFWNISIRKYWRLDQARLRPDKAKETHHCQVKPSPCQNAPK